MKIREFAEGIGITQGAIYKAILRAGYSTKKLTDKKGDITSAGMKILRRIYPEAAEDQQPEREPEPGAEQEPESIINALRDQLRDAEGRRVALDAELKSVRDQLTEARNQAEKWERLYIELQKNAANERAEMRREIDSAHLIAAQAQHLKVNPIKRLFSGRKEAQNVSANAEIK